MNRSPAPAQQAGGFAMGLIVGLLVGLALALAVALYIAKVPVPFVDKVPHRTAEEQAAEADRLKNWDPNAGLGGKPVAKPAAAPVADGGTSPPPAASAVAAAAPAAPPVVRPVAPAPEAASKPASSTRDPFALLAGQPVPGDKKDKADGTAGAAGRDPFIYFVQAGAYSNVDDAEQQRAKLAMQGINSKVSEREQGGRLVHRVRVGPFDSKAEAEAQQDKLRGAGAEAVLVRIERPRPGSAG